MNPTTNLNSELLSADARGRKHIPFAIFAVIMIHVVLFLVLLVAAGCRAKARAKGGVTPAPVVQLASDGIEHNDGMETLAASNSGDAVTSQVEGADGTLQTEIAPALPASRTKPNQSGKAVAEVSQESATHHIVQPGDTVEKIARRYGTTIQAIKSANNLKNHLIFPGQKLRVQKVQVQATKSQGSNDV